jgi:predicted Zn-dependent protease
MLLLTIPFSRQATLRQWHSSTFWYEVLEAIERKRLADAERWLAKGVAAYPDAHWVPWAEAAVLLGREEYRNAREIYVNLLGDSEAEIGSEGLLQNNVAWIDLMIGDPALLAEADQFSEQALAAAPSVASFKGTRGSVLVELGRIDEGVPLLEQALRENVHRHSKALNACYLALVAARRADKTAARRYIDLAKRHDSACPLLGRANRALGCQSPDNA